MTKQQIIHTLLELGVAGAYETGALLASLAVEAGFLDEEEAWRIVGRHRMAKLGKG
jgi:hypothetical protein